MKSSCSFLGIDCSAYTTSMALVDGEERLLWERRLALPVRRGALGLRQSEAVFAHIKNLPPLWEEGAARLKDAPLAAVAASTRPRPVAGSYMPVFKVSEAAGTLISRTLGLPFYAFSHQEGHIAAALWSCGLPPGPYLAVHLSGGTTELLSVVVKEGASLEIARIGGGSDLHAGQFVDRVGVAMGLSFPAGSALEDWARRGRSGGVTLPVAVKGTAISFSGPASHALRLLQRGVDPHDLARAVETCIADSLAQALHAACVQGDYTAILVAGGVAANSFIRRRLVQKGPRLPFHFASPSFAGDNAAGLAVLAERRYAAGEEIRKGK
ncbi:MAG: O-sialoglycoprotein endopeptidase [Firmicutes bacterium]|nr:O-sialoglycoprotein endopeptidase [Bacillota bacterium]